MIKYSKILLFIDKIGIYIGVDGPSKYIDIGVSNFKLDNTNMQTTN